MAMFHDRIKLQDLTRPPKVNVQSVQSIHLFMSLRYQKLEPILQPSTGNPKMAVCHCCIRLIVQVARIIAVCKIVGGSVIGIILCAILVPDQKHNNSFNSQNHLIFSYKFSDLGVLGSPIDR